MNKSRVYEVESLVFVGISHYNFSLNVYICVWNICMYANYTTIQIFTLFIASHLLPPPIWPIYPTLPPAIKPVYV